MQEKIKLVIIIATLSNGGAERIAALLSENLPENFEVSFLLYKDEVAYSYSGDKYILNVNTNNKIIKQVLNLREINRYIDQIEPDLTLSFLTNPNILNLLSISHKRIISVRGVRSKSLKGLGGFIYKNLIKLFYNKADSIIALSKGVKEDLVDNFKIQSKIINIIYNFCDIERINSEKNIKLDIKNHETFKKPSVITAGRLEFPKGHFNLLRAFKNVKNSVHDAQLIILGKGKLKKDLVKLSKELNIFDSVHFLGFVQNPFKYFSESDVFVLPSIMEGFGNVIIEAMACTLPIISTDCIGPKEILSNTANIKVEDEILYAEHGILTPVFKDNKYRKNNSLTKEEVLFSDAIINVLKDSSLKDRYKLESQKRVKDFSKDKIVKNWIKAINDCNAS